MKNNPHKFYPAKDYSREESGRKGQISNKTNWFYLIGIFLILALPLLSVPPLFHPAPWGKSVVFRIIFSILIFFFIWQIIFSKRSAFSTAAKKLLSRKNEIFWPFWLLAALFGIFSLATIFSLDPHFSFWGSPYRGGGFLTLGLIMVFAVFLFLFLRKKDWQKIIDFSLGIGSITAIIAIFQKLGLFSKYMRSYSERTVSTMGGPIFFALYLTLLIFLALSFSIATKGKKRMFYFSSFVLLLVGIILAATRAAFLGLIAGSLFFILFYPKKISGEKFNKKFLWIKIFIGLILISGILGIFWLKTQPQIVQNLKENEIFGYAFNRVWQIADEKIPFSESIMISRGNGWKVLFEGVKKRPILGYGPENVSIAFDKYYNPKLLGIQHNWWDRGHSFIFDISVSAGIPALIIYLLLFTALFWQLQRIKNRRESAEIGANPRWRLPTGRQAIIAHGLQATFIGYLITDFLSFDVFSTYLVLFLIIAYSFHLIFSSNDIEGFNYLENKPQNNLETDPAFWKYIFITLLFFVFSWFIWSGNLKPLFINKKINQYVFLSEKIYSSHYANPTLTKKQEQILLKKMDGLLAEKSVIDNYLRLQYIDIIAKATVVLPKNTSELSLKAIQILRECQKLRPYYTRNWLYVVVYINKYIESTPNADPKFKEKLNKEARLAIQRAKELNPKRPDIFIAMAGNYLINKEYQRAEKQAEQCTIIAPDNGECWWAKALSLIGAKRIPESLKAMETAKQKGYATETKRALGQLINVYGNLARKTGEKKYYQYLAALYQKLIQSDKERIKEIEKSKKIKIPENFQYHASLAYIYKVLEEYDKARKEAEVVMKLSPASKKSVEIFLKTLPSEK